MRQSVGLSCLRPPSRFLAFAWATAISLAGLAAAAPTLAQPSPPSFAGPDDALAAGPLTITLGSQETMWLDANKCSAEGPRAAWISFIIKNTGTDPVNNITVTFSGFGGTNGSYFSAPADLTRIFSRIAGGAQEPVYFYVDYSEVCNHPQGGGSPYAGYTGTYSLTVTGTGVSTVVRNGTVTTNELLTANAAGVAVATTLGPGFYVGQLLTQTVTYQFGNNSDLFFQPAGDAGFDSRCIRLVGSEITNVDGTISPSLIGLKDQLWFPAASVPAGGGNIYLTYTWEILCVNRTQSLHPWAAAKSGNKYKYQGFQSATIFPASQTALTAAKSVSPASLTDNTGGPVAWTVTFSNPSLVPLVLSKITDVLPSCMSIANPAASGSQVNAANSSSIPAVGATGTVNWVGLDLGDSPSSTYQVPAGGSIALKYSTNVTGCSFPASYTNSATGTVGTTTVGPVTATLIIGSLPSIALAKSAGPTTYTAAGQVITYTYTITNTGNVTLAGPFSVSDNKLGTISPCGSGPLASGASTSCTANTTITQANLDAGFITNTATATTVSNGQTVTSNASTATVTATQTKALTLTKSANPATYGSVGQTITYTYTVKNAGNVTLSGPFIVTDDKQGTISPCGSGPLAPGATTSCTSTHVITQADLDAGSLTNTATASGSGVASNTTSATVTAAAAPHLSLAKVAAEQAFTNPGDVIHYTLTATNDGNITLTGVSISDPFLGTLTCAQPVTLAPGATLTCTGTHTITNGDINDGRVTNTATATGQTPSGTTLTATASAAVPPLAITLAKAANPMTYSGVAQVIAYTYMITNTGGAQLAGPFSVADDRIGTISPCGTGPLAVGASTTCTASYTVTQADLNAGSVTNTATASGNGVTSNTATATASAVQTVALALVKSANPTAYSAVGQTITYTYTITNTGNVTLNGPFSVSDSKLGTISPCGSGPLAPGATTSCTGPHTITQADLDAGSILNTATASGSGAVSNQGSALVTGAPAPHLSLTKSGSPATFSQAGQVITYTLKATNDGNVTLFDVRISDPLLGSLSCAPSQPATLAPGVMLTCTGTYTTTAADVAAARVINTATAIGTDPTNTPVEATASAAIPPLALTLAKTASPMTYDQVGQTITYTYTITNTGAVLLAGPFSVTDDKVGTISPCGIGPLSPGSSTSCPKTYAITQSDLDGGFVLNTATASGGGATTAPAYAVVTAMQAPRLSLTKTGDPAIFTQAGQVITYTLTATNGGNVTLFNLGISDPLLGALSCSMAQPAILAPGESLTCIGTYTTTPADLAAGHVINTATAAATDPTNTPVVATASAAVPPLALTLAKTADPMTYGVVGQLITYTYTITNTGGSTLAGPFSLTDNKLGVLANCAPGPLAVGASTTCTAQHAITQADLDAGSLSNSATVSGNGATSIPASATVSAQQAPALTLAKTANPTTYEKNNDVITYTYKITNTGNVTLYGPYTVNDDKIGSPVACGTGALAPGASVTCSAPYSITPSDVQAGSVTNSAVAAASNNGHTMTSNQATVTVTVQQAGALTLTKSADPATYSAVGQTITYTYVIQNTGNVELAGPFSVSDDKQGTIGPCGVGPLAPGATTSCTSPHPVTQADLDAGSITNKATASGNGVTSDQATATVIAVQTKALTLTKSASPTVYSAAGQTVLYTYVVKNTGNVTLAGPFSVTDDKQGTINPCGSGPLAPLATTSCTSAHGITLADLSAGSITNTATASGNGAISNPAKATVTTATITVDKVTFPVGSSQLFSFITAGISPVSSDAYQLADATAPHTTWVLPGTYKVTETAQTGWVTTASCSGGPFGAGTAYTNGAQFTVSAGDKVTCTVTNTMTVAAFCSKSEPQTVLNPTSGRFKNNKGFDVVVRTDLGQNIQAAVDTVVDYNKDGYIIVGVVTNGTAKLGGDVTQSVDITRAYDKPFGLLACSVSLHDPVPSDSNPTGHVAASAAAPVPTGQTGNIFIMDLHAADSQVAGWKIEGDGRYLRNVVANNNAVGVWFAGNNNTMQNGNGQSNKGAGMLIEGNGNKTDTTYAFSNLGPGVQVTGNNNQLLKMDVGEVGKGNAGSGIIVNGFGNIVQENFVYNNGGDGIVVSGGTAASPNILKKNVAGAGGKGNKGNGIVLSGAGSGATTPIEIEQNTAKANALNGFKIDGTGQQLKNNISGGSTLSETNGDCEYLVVAGNLNFTGNKSNGVTVAGTSGSPFPTGCTGSP